MENSDHNRLEIDNLPNRLTVFRVVLIPFIILPLMLKTTDWMWANEYRSFLGWFAGWVFTAASVTDFFDGYIARKRQIVTVFGSFIDPIADKFLMVSSLIMLEALGSLPALLVIILVLREMYMTSLRLLATNEGLSVPISQMGKWKSASQMVGIPFVMTDELWWGVLPMPMVGTILLYIAGILSLWSAITYTISLMRNFKQKKMQKVSPK